MITKNIKLSVISGYCRELQLKQGYTTLREWLVEPGILGYWRGVEIDTVLTLLKRRRISSRALQS